MKKILSYFFSAFLLLSLCSCSDYVDIEDRLIVSTIGLDKSPEGVKMTFEYVNPKSGSEGSTNSKIISGTGHNFYAALENLSSLVTKPLFFSHCGALVFGDNLNKKDIESAFDFCAKSSEVTLLIRIIAAENAYELLSAPDDSVPVKGYEIMSLLDTTENTIPIANASSFINIANCRLEENHVYAIPYISLKKENDRYAIKIIGTKIYEDDIEKFRLNEEEAELFEICDGRISRAEIILSDEGKTVAASIGSNKVNITPHFLNGNLQLDFTITQTTEEDSDYSFIKEQYKSIIEKRSLALIKASQEKAVDIFSVRELLRKNHQKIYKSVNLNYKNYYKSAKINLKFIIKDD